MLMVKIYCRLTVTVYIGDYYVPLLKSGSSVVSKKTTCVCGVCVCVLWTDDSSIIMTTLYYCTTTTTTTTTVLLGLPQKVSCYYYIYCDCAKGPSSISF
jgi:hypothetical protein